MATSRFLLQLTSLGLEPRSAGDIRGLNCSDPRALDLLLYDWIAMCPFESNNRGLKPIVRFGFEI